MRAPPGRPAPPTYTPDRATPPACANCGAPAAAYCPTCGQAVADYHRPLRAMGAELLDSLAGWDGKIPTSLWLLVRHPGRLTAEFLAGRRVRYLRPLRLFLSTSVLLLLTLRWSADRADPSVDRLIGGERTGVTRRPAAAGPGAPANAEPQTVGEALGRVRAQPRGAAALDSARLGGFLAHRDGEGGGGVRARMQKLFKDRLRTLSRMDAAERGAVVREAFFAKLGNMLFALVPVFALVVGLLWRRAGRFYAEHLVFALHVHAFAMLALTAATLAPAPLNVLALAAISAHLFVALRRVYGGSRRRTLAKAAVLAAGYGFVLVTATTVTALLAVMLG